MSLLRRSFILVCLALGWIVAARSAPSIRAQDLNPAPTFRAWTQQHGLPTNEVTGLSRSRSGYLFVGTPNGVVRFDGQRFSPVTHLTEIGLHDRGISAFASVPGSDDVLAAPRTGGLLRLSADGFSDQPLPARFADTPIEALFFENDITLWIGFKGGIALRRQAARVEIFDASSGLSPHEPVQFARDGDGYVWLASGSFLARYKDGRLLEIPAHGPHPKEQIRIASSRRDGPWVIAGERLGKFRDERLTPVTTLGEATGAYYIQSLLEDSSGVLWIGTRSRGLHRLTPGDRSPHHVVEAPDDISALLEDTVGNLWIGATSGGILRIKTGVLKIFDRSAGLVENRSLTLCREENDTLWFANRDGGLAYAEKGEKFAHFEPTRGWDNFSAYAVTPARGGGIWATTTQGVLRIAEGKIMEHLSPAFLTGREAPRVALTARNGDLWLALNAGGLCRVRGTEMVRFGAENGLGTSLVRTLAEDPRGSLWAGCDDGSVHRLDESARFSRIDLQSTAEDAGAIQAIHFDHAGTAWIGTQKSGLIRLAEARARRIDTRSGLIAENITHIVSDDQGVLWLGSPGAIFHVRIDELERLLEGSLPRIYPVALGPDEGLSEATCSSEYQPSVLKTGDGLLWFATRQGVIAIDPAKESRTPERLRATVTTAWLDGRQQKAATTLRVKPGMRSIELGYSAPNLSTPERVRIRYRLTGYEDAWSENTRERSSRYTRLPPGRYRFEIAAILAGVPGTESGDSITLEVQAAWWQTLWFRTLVGIAVLLAIIVVVRLVSHRRLHEKLARLERETALERERTRIAHNIHDDLGAGLTRISLLTQSGQDKPKHQLERIYGIVGDLTQSMDEIVWAVNPTNDDLENVANYISEYAQGYLSDAGLRCRVRIPGALPAHVLTAQFRHHLFLTCKEALNNVVKHAHATDVSIEINATAATLVVAITDNGIGLPPEVAAASHRNGLKNMRLRMREIGGDLEISQAPQRGTVVTLTAALSTASAS